MRPPSAARGRENKVDAGRRRMSACSARSRASQFRAASSLLALFVTLQVPRQLSGEWKSLRMSVICAIEAGLCLQIALHDYLLSLKDAFVELYGGRRSSMLGCSWPSLKTVFSLAALGAAGITIGAYFVQK